MNSPIPELRIRSAARAVILTPDQHLLLVRFEFPAGTRWALPGGGLDEGEDHLTALHRELGEEVGLHDANIGPHIWTREHHFAFLDGLWDGQREQIYLVNSAHKFAPTPTMNWQALNAEYLFEIRWWHIDEIAAAREIIFAPKDIHRHLAQLTTVGIPASPIDVGA